jgi:hypothetical protein
MNARKIPAPKFPATQAGARAFFEAALALVESPKIRAWATTEHNKPLFVEEARLRLKKGRDDVHSLATCVVSHAIGL